MRLGWIPVLAATFGLSLAAQTATVAGQFLVEPPTLVSLGFEWKITGDDNRNAKVDVVYRKKGETPWRDALPLLRLQREEIGTAQNGGDPARYPLFRYTAANMFAGSILNLDPDTEYECRFTLTDPDGVTGAATQTVTVRTRAEPRPASGGKTYHVYPVDWTGPKQQPAFTGLMAAYYMGSAHYDYENAYPPRVQPGDTIRVDLAGVDWVDSVGIGAFVSVWASAKKAGCDLRFRNPNKLVQDVVELTKLYDLFEKPA